MNPRLWCESALGIINKGGTDASDPNPDAFFCPAGASIPGLNLLKPTIHQESPPTNSALNTMASVTSLDKDLRNLRLGKYTPQAADEVRRWIEDTLGEPLAPGDLLDALKDGTALCKYA